MLSRSLDAQRAKRCCNQASTLYNPFVQSCDRKPAGYFGDLIVEMLSVRTTTQVAELLGVSGGTIRNAKSRHADKLRENEHWGKGADDKLWWTDAGCERLSQLIPSAASYQTAKPERLPLAETSETPSKQEEAILDLLAQSLAVERLKQRLEPKVEQHYQQLIAALAHLFEHPEQLPDRGIEDILQMVGLSIAALRAARAFASFNKDAAKLLNKSDSAAIATAEKTDKASN